MGASSEIDLLTLYDLLLGVGHLESIPSISSPVSFNCGRKKGETK